MRIYIAHPYTGDEERNRERALKAEELLRQATPRWYGGDAYLKNWKQVEIEARRKEKMAI